MAILSRTGPTSSPSAVARGVGGISTLPTLHYTSSPFSSEFHLATTSNAVESPGPTASHSHGFKDEAYQPFRQLRENWALLQGPSAHKCLSACERLKADYARPGSSNVVESPGYAASYNNLSDHSNRIEGGWLS